MTATTHESALAEEIERFQHDTQTLALFGSKPVGSDIAKKSAKAKFCAVWPQAREALAALELLVPASVRMIISIVRSAGDAAAAQACRPG